MSCCGLLCRLRNDAVKSSNPKEIRSQATGSCISFLLEMPLSLVYTWWTVHVGGQSIPTHGLMQRLESGKMVSSVISMKQWGRIKCLFSQVLSHGGRGLARTCPPSVLASCFLTCLESTALKHIFASLLMSKYTSVDCNCLSLSLFWWYWYMLAR